MIVAGKLMPVAVVLDASVPSVYWMLPFAAIVPAKLTTLFPVDVAVLVKSSITKVNVTGLPLTWKPLILLPKFQVIKQLCAAQVVDVGRYFVPLSKRYELLAMAVSVVPDEGNAVPEMVMLVVLIASDPPLPGVKVIVANWSPVLLERLEFEPS